jgi:cysteine-rich repeat protein
MLAPALRPSVWSLLVAGGALACGRTTLAPTPTTADGPRPARADAALAPDLPAGMGADSAPPPIADLAPASGPDLVSDPRNANCGNGRLEPAEECDDGNTVSGDGCAADCTVECAWTPCPWPPYAPAVVCGDGRVGNGESCDDGNLADGDGCSALCAIEPGFHCARPGFRCAPICGDGTMVGGETCDDGNTANGDGCSENCLVEPCWDCASGVCRPKRPVVDGGNACGLPTVWCGDGRIEGAEECDDGSENSDIGYGGCSTHCRFVICGDGIVNGPETCDLGWERNTAVYGDPDGCTDACTRPGYCGDGIVQSDYGETCDEGAANGQSLCGPVCRIFLP